MTRHAARSRDEYLAASTAAKARGLGLSPAALRKRLQRERDRAKALLPSDVTGPHVRNAPVTGPSDPPIAEPHSVEAIAARETSPPLANETSAPPVTSPPIPSDVTGPSPPELERQICRLIWSRASDVSPAPADEAPPDEQIVALAAIWRTTGGPRTISNEATRQTWVILPSGLKLLPRAIQNSRK
jgi:hypothetical protein